MKKDDRRIIYAIIATGIASVAAQLISVRESLCSFGGNELVISIFLFDWLIFGAAGTLLAYLSDRFWKSTPFKIACLMLVLVPVFIGQILFMRRIEALFILPGSIADFNKTFLLISIFIGPGAILVGFLLPFSLFSLSQKDSVPATLAYLADNLGDITGAILFTFVLVTLLTPIQGLCTAGALIIASSLPLLGISRLNLKRLLLLFFTGLILLFSLAIEKETLTMPWGRLVLYKESKYGRISGLAEKDQVTLFYNGVPAAIARDISSAEEAVHYPLSQIDLNKQKRILLISGVPGIFDEIEKYPGVHANYLEIDPEMTRALVRFGLLVPGKNINFIYTDGRYYLKTSPASYDAILVNINDPETFQANRFFTQEFFALAKSRLRPDGILSFSVKGYANYPSPATRNKLAILYNTASSVFKDVTMIPGRKIYFLCKDGSMDIDIPQILSRRKISTAYIANYFYGNVTAERVSGLLRIAKAPASKNQDLFPVLVRVVLGNWFERFSTSPQAFVAILAAMIILYLFFINRYEFVLFSTGFFSMGSEIIVIFAFQVFFGYIYTMIGLIVTAFLAGLLPGALLGHKPVKQKRFSIMLSEVILIFLGIFFFAAITFYPGMIGKTFLLLYGFFVSFMCGFQFPRIFESMGSKKNAAARAFSSDLIGAAFGAIAVSMGIIPFFGLPVAAACLVILKLISMVIFSKRIA